jgi:hypothetical protein
MICHHLRLAVNRLNAIKQSTLGEVTVVWSKE